MLVHIICLSGTSRAEGALALFSFHFPQKSVGTSLPLIDGHDVKMSVRVTAPRFELTSQRQKVSRLPTEPPGRPIRRVSMVLTMTLMLVHIICLSGTSRAEGALAPFSFLFFSYYSLEGA